MNNLETKARLTKEEVAQRNKEMICQVANYYRDALKELGCMSIREIKNSRNQLINLIKERLTDAEKEVVFLTYGIIDGRIRKFEETAKVLGITAEQVEEIDRVSFLKICPSCSYEESIWKKVNPKILPSVDDLANSKRIIESFVSTLTNIEQKIYEMREHGIVGEPMMLKEIGKKLNMDARKVGKIEMIVHRKIVKYCLKELKAK